MSGEIDIILEEFCEELVAIKSLLNVFDQPSAATPKVRVAAANSATLLLAATFEEFVREMARAYARAIVELAGSFDKIPSRMAATAWRRTMEKLAKIQIDPRSRVFSADSVFEDALTKFQVVYSFCKGDLSQDIFSDLVHNENNMRPGQINALFKISDLNDVCQKVCDKQALLEFLGQSEQGKTHGKLLEELEAFFERRNEIAHAVNLARSSGPDQILQSIGLLEAFGNSLRATLVRSIQLLMEQAGARFPGAA